MWSTIDRTESISVASKAGMKPLTTKPGTNIERSQNSSALSIKEKSPRVRMVIGSVNSPSRGRIVTPTMPHSKATKSAVPKLGITIPGTKRAIRSSAPAVIKIWSSVLNIVAS